MHKAASSAGSDEIEVTASTMPPLNPGVTGTLGMVNTSSEKKSAEFTQPLHTGPSALSRISIEILTRTASGTHGRRASRDANAIGRASLELGRASNEIQRKRADDMERTAEEARIGKKLEDKKEEHVSAEFQEAPKEGLTSAGA